MLEVAHLLVPIKGCVSDADNFKDASRGARDDGGEVNSNVGT